MSDLLTVVGFSASLSLSHCIPRVPETSATIVELDVNSLPIHHYLVQFILLSQTFNKKEPLDFSLWISPLPVCEHLVSTTSEGCPYSRKVSPRRPAVIPTIGAFGIRDSNSEIATSSTHTADNCPSAYIGLPILELPSNTPPTTEMISEDRLWAMEEELMKHQMKSDAIEISYKLSLTS